MDYTKKRLERLAVSFDDYMLTATKEEKEIQERIAEIINNGCEKWFEAEDLDLEDGSEYVFQTEPFLLELGVWDAAQAMFFCQGKYIEKNEVYAIYK